MPCLHEARLPEVDAFHNRKCDAVNTFHYINVGLFHSWHTSWLLYPSGKCVSCKHRIKEGLSVESTSAT